MAREIQAANTIPLHRFINMANVVGCCPGETTLRVAIPRLLLVRG